MTARAGLGERLVVETSWGPQPVLVRRSARRTRTLSARWEDEGLVILAPSRSAQGEEALIRRLAERLLARRERESPRGDAAEEALAARAARLIDAHFPGLEPPASVRWVTNQSTRWGSCTVGARTVRLSHLLAGMPDWVIDSVLVHELAHLIEPSHGPAFWALCNRHPRMAEARIFLEGVEQGMRLSQRP